MKVQATCQGLAVDSWSVVRKQRVGSSGDAISANENCHSQPGDSLTQEERTSCWERVSLIAIL